ncbi:hypothetical protein BH10BDE1_BH10BDE1_09990 [soil metagenome]
MSTPSISQRTRDFLATGNQFRLGSLVTESPNPSTHDLSQACQQDLSRAVDLFKFVELDALKTLKHTDSVARDLVVSIERCFSQNRRVFLCGCGATGRLALVLESIWRQAPKEGLLESVVAFTAGGDYALVRSLGVFEDRPDLGAKHLLDLGFQDGDMLIAITEGGETPFVLGALDQATKSSRSDSWLFFCNPPDLLKKLVERSRRAMENPGVKWHAFETDPMALTGSTRLQASSVLMAFVGACLREVATGQKASWIISELFDRIAQMDPKVFIPLIEMESEAHLRGEFTLHRSRSAAMPVLTDTTERAPTFSLAPFESAFDEPTTETSSRTYLEIPRAATSLEAWHHLLRRDPRPFIVPEGVRAPKVDLGATVAFDFSDGVATRREKYGISTSTIIDIEFGDYDGTTPDPTLFFRGTRTTDGAERKYEVNVPASRDPLIRQSQMKYALNLQSTLTMGRIGRFHGNLMTFVRPTNNKLIDRALRTLRILALEDARATRDSAFEKTALSTNDESFLNAIFEAFDTVTADQPVALKALEILKR